MAAVQCDGARDRLLIRFGMEGYRAQIPAALAAKWKNIPHQNDDSKCLFDNGQKIVLSITTSTARRGEGGGDVNGYFTLVIDGHDVYEEKQFYIGQNLSTYIISAVGYNGKSLLECNPHQVGSLSYGSVTSTPKCYNSSFRLAPGNHLSEQEWTRLHPRHYPYGFGWDQRLYHCKKPSLSSVIICSDLALVSELSILDNRYAVLLRSQEPDIAYLAFRDRWFYFRGQLRSCNDLATGPFPSAKATSCLTTVITDQINALKGRTGKKLLLDQLLKAFALDAGLVERFPKVFLGHKTMVAGSDDLHRLGTADEFDGTFTDPYNGKTYEMRVERASKQDLVSYAAEPFFSGWMKGKFVKQDGRIVFLGSGF